MNKRIFKPFCFSLLGLTTLVSCNTNKKLKEINDESAIKIATNIIKRENSEDFKLPDNFSIIESKSKKIDTRNPEDGSIVTNYIIKKEYYFDINNLRYKSKQTRTSSIDVSSINIEEYYYFDSNNNFVHLVNNNGYKTKTIDTSVTSKEQAKENLNMIKSSISGDYQVTNHEQLINVETNINTYKTMKELIKNEKDQYVNNYFGSNDEKSFQQSGSYKFLNKETYKQEVIFSGYVTSSTNLIFENDLLETQSSKVNKDYIGEYFKEYYYKSSDTTEVNCKYGNINITLPNIDEYKLGE